VRENIGDRESVAALVDELDDLVCMLSMHDDLIFHEGPPGSGWYFHPTNRTINADSKDLDTKTAEYCRGLATHEAAHAAITRYHDLIPKKLLKKTAISTLLNVIEDCRIEEWMQKRLPGCRDWVEQYNTALFSPFLREEGLPKSASGQFCMSILSRWWYGKVPQNIQPIVLDALDEAWPDIQMAIDAQPPSSLIEDNYIQRLYQQHPTSRAYLSKDIFDAPNGIEMLVRMYQFNMWGIVYNRILPVFLRLNKHDEKTEGNGLDLEHLLNNIRPVPSPNQLPVSCLAPNGGGWTLAVRGGHSSGSTGGVSEEIERALEVSPQDMYLQTWKKLYSQIDELAESLIRILENSRRTKWKRFQSFGARLDVRMVMQYEADRTLYNRIWQHRSNPKRIDPGFVLLLDTSGSMNGEPIRHAFKAVVLITEVCSRLNIPLDIWTFNSTAHHVQSWDSPIDEQTRLQLGSIVQNCRGGTLMSKAVSRVTLQLNDLPHKDKAIFVLGDGVPNNQSATLSAVRQLEALGCATIGLGIGEESTGLSRFFRKGLYDVPIEQVPSSLAKLLGDYFGKDS
jgi:hypothetical protein